MATSMNTARIGLSFEESDIENSWFLVDFSKHTTVEDVGNEIKYQYLRSMKNDDTVVLRINDFLLPAFGKSILFRENDIVSVRLVKTVKKRNRCSTGVSEDQDKDALTESEEKIYSNTDEHCRQITTSESSSKQLTTPLMTKKRARSDRDRSLEHSDYDKKRRLTEHKSEKKKKRRSRSLTQVAIEENQSEEKIKKKSKKKVSATSTDADTSTMDDSVLINNADKRGVVILPKQKETSEQNNIAVVNDSVETGIDLDNKFPNVEPDMLTDDSQVTDDSHPTDSSTKRKRQRHRKKRNRVTSHSSEYNGKDVDKKESVYYGSLPDKLEPPKYYRHGYRNLQSYQVEPNTHKTFGSDSDPENTEESTQQYNFLCKSRKSTETKFHELFDNVIPNGNETCELNSIMSDETWTDASVGSLNNSYSALNGNNESDIANKQLSPSEYYIARPFQYAEAPSQYKHEQPSVHDSAGSTFPNIETSPVQLEKKMLTNGVSVFVRQRVGHASRFKELSKQEQLNTRSTNVSTVFVNSEEPQFKVPTSPAPRQKSSLKPDVSAVDDPEATDPVASHNPWPTSGTSVAESYAASNSPASQLTDCTKWKPLVGMPEPGNMIAYKVLEISVNCTPEVSDYKIGKVLSVGNDQMLEIKHSHQEVHKTKFHVEIEDADEILTNTRDTSDVVSLHLTSMLEPRIVGSQLQCE